ncbi:MAG TPA: hypothetical protein VJ576_18030 [Rhodocyclaceae bacterium]|nr:hypothetical protein [Rhodocyclaceae bacterium]
MQVNEIKQRFDQFEHCVEDAMQVCQQDSHVSQQLADSLSSLDREVHQAHDMICNAQQESAEMVDCIDRLEQMGDDVKRACQSASDIDQKTQDAMLDVHRKISDLKHQIQMH